MSEALITCPHCKQKFAITEAMSHEIEESLRAKYAREKQTLIEERDRLLEAKDREITEKLKSEKTKLEMQLREQVKHETGGELQALKERLLLQDQKLAASQRKELELLKREETLKDQQREFELESARKLAAQQDEIYKKAREKADEEYKLKLAESEKRATDAVKTAEELKRKLEQGSQQSQGEILELQLEAALRTAFPTDIIDPVPKGMTGGDVVHTVNGLGGAATILWEFKNTKAWSDGWIDKLKENQRAIKADLAVIVTRALPKGVQNCGWRDGVWVTDIDTMHGLATAVRFGLMEVMQARAAADGKHSKMELMYGYLSGNEFRARVAAVVEAFQQMQTDLSKERTAMEKLWNSREKQLQKAILNMAGMYGDLQGIIGQSLPDLKILELPGSENGQG
jgi:hypothetical protein